MRHFIVIIVAAVGLLAGCTPEPTYQDCVDGAAATARNINPDARAVDVLNYVKAVCGERP